MSVDVHPTHTFDEILEHVGGWGKFQLKLLGIFIVSAFILGYVGYAPILYLYVPDHWCAIPLYYEETLNLSSQADLINLT